MTATWQVLHSKPHSAKFLCEQLLCREFEAFCPRICVYPANPRARKVKPYFPGYVFVRAAIEQTNWTALQWVPGAIGLVSFGGEPACVPDTLIHAIRLRANEINDMGRERLDNFKQGDEVLINGGPFDGYKAIFETTLRGSERVRVLLKFLEVKQKLELSIKQIQPKKRR